MYPRIEIMAYVRNQSFQLFPNKDQPAQHASNFEGTVQADSQSLGKFSWILIPTLYMLYLSSIHFLYSGVGIWNFRALSQTDNEALVIYVAGSILRWRIGDFPLIKEMCKMWGSL